MSELRDLHAHITGSIDSDGLIEIIERNNLHVSDTDRINSITEPMGIRLASGLIKDPESAKNQFRELYPCRPDGKINFDRILKRFSLVSYLVGAVPNTEAEIGRIAAKKFKKQGVGYVEWRVDPFSSTMHQSADEGADKLHRFYDGLSEVKGIDSRLVLSIAKNRYGSDWVPIPEKIAYLKDQMKSLFDRVSDLPIVGIDAVNRDEIPLSSLESVLSLAEENGLALIPHVGEMDSHDLETDLDNIETAVRLGAKRLGHAVSAYAHLDGFHGSKDASGVLYGPARISKLEYRQKGIMDLLADKQVAVEVCPTSNMTAHLGIKDYSLHPIDRLIDKGIPFVVCTDDYGIFGSSLKNEIYSISRAKSIDRDKIIANSVKYSADNL